MPADIGLNAPPTAPVYYPPAPERGSNVNPAPAVDAVEMALPVKPDTSGPVFTTEVGEAILTVLRVRTDGIISHQVYAVTAASWELIGVELLYVDALMAAAGFKKFLAEGGTITDWKVRHPDGVRPRMLFRIEKGQHE
jgi:hypothetical protein